MKVLFVSVEVSPFAKVGGLADVAGSLPKALKDLGHDVRVIMPHYSMIDAAKFPISDACEPFETSINPLWHKHTTLRKTDLDDVPVYLVGDHEWFQFGVQSEAIYTPGVDKYLFFSQAVLQACLELDWIPDVIHCNDWHTGFIPVLSSQHEWFKSVATVFTIHNLAYQGLFDIDILDKLGLPHYLYNASGVEAWGRVNFLKSGCAFADHVNTVSESYAQEILTPEYGETLDGLMRHLNDQGLLSGIRNGIDQDFFDPAKDPDIIKHYSADDVSGKRECKEALLEELGLEEIEGAPLFGMVGRLSSQKGLDLVVNAAETLFSLPIQLVILGAGDTHIAHDLLALQAKYPKNLKFVEGFHLTLAPRIYAGCDAFLMPSRFEPCGLGQLIAMRYGTVPCVRKTGGLGDTVQEGWNGFVFDSPDSGDMVSAIRRLREAFATPNAWNQLIKHGMAYDSSWPTSAKQYASMYRRAIDHRQASHLQSA